MSKKDSSSDCSKTLNWIRFGLFLIMMTAIVLEINHSAKQKQRSRQTQSMQHYQDSLRGQQAWECFALSAKTK